MKYGKLLILALSACLITGCGAADEYIEEDNNEVDAFAYDVEVKEIQDETANGMDDDIIVSATEVYNKFFDMNAADKTSSIKSIMTALGNMDYVAVDIDNRINMTNYNKLVDFINNSKREQEDVLTVLQLSYDGNLSELLLQTFEGNVSVFQKTYLYDGTNFNLLNSADYAAEVFDYTPEGYLMIEGHWDSEQMYILSLSDEEEHIAFRVSPMDSRLRELTEKYLDPVSYGQNNLFITNWSEDDFADIDFYDVFEIFYEKFYNKPMPYVMSEDLSVGNEYEVPAKELEDVVMAYFPIDADTLRLRLRYDDDTDCYIFRPRGYGESDYCDIPYPEVASFTEEDGVLTLEVNAVFPTDNTSKLFSHEVKISDVDGKITCLGNKVDIEDSDVLWWHTRRMTDGEWQKNYGDSENGVVSAGDSSDTDISGTKDAS